MDGAHVNQPIKRPSNARQTPGPRELPARIPEELPELDEAVMLLGNFYTHGTALKASRREQLAALIGELPRSREECATWKSALKGYRKELAELEKESG